MEIVQAKTADLIPYGFNNRDHSQQQIDRIANSINEFGFNQPIVVDEQNIVLVGHGRLEAAKKLGLEDVPVLKKIGLSETQKKAYRILDNKLQNDSTWNFENLGLELSTLEDSDFDISTWGLEGLLELMPAQELEVTEDDFEPVLEQSAYIKLGDIISLGEHRVMCGDSTKAEDVGRLMAGAKADLCFTSPPYGASNVAKLRDHYVRGAAKRKSFYDQHEDDPESWLSLMNGWYDAYRPVSECVICNVQMLADNKRHMVAWLAERAGDLCDVIVWEKANPPPQMQANVLSNAFEFCFVFGGNASRSIPFADFHGTLSNVIRIDQRRKNDQSDKHRAVFPIELPTWFIQTLCKKSRSIVDPFCGTGTTLIAAEQLGRKCYGMEISPLYCQVIVDRYKAHCEKAGRPFVCKLNGEDVSSYISTADHIVDANGLIGT
jgi:DNA modification methylase